MRFVFSVLLVLSLVLVVSFLPVVSAETNLCPVPEFWGSYPLFGDVCFSSVYPATGNQITSYDESVERTAGAGSIKIEHYKVGTENLNHEVDSDFISVSAGNMVVFSGWIKTGEHDVGYSHSYGGARFGIDFYDANRITAKQDGTDEFFPYVTDEENNAFYVDYNSGDWVYREMIFYVPSYIQSDGSYYDEFELRTPTRMILWLQVWDNYATPNTGAGDAWFADLTCYVYSGMSPTPSFSPSPYPTVAPSATPEIESSEIGDIGAFMDFMLIFLVTGLPAVLLGVVGSKQGWGIKGVVFGSVIGMGAGIAGGILPVWFLAFMGMSVLVGGFVMLNSRRGG